MSVESIAHIHWQHAFEVVGHQLDDFLARQTAKIRRRHQFRSSK
jgi:hypothetical protein